ncbi:MAG: glycosyltransferase family 39 protein [Chloroflexi bacterium]|nr:glycosyltransferase family 39 protein [Chloroflexota bacterium]
MISRSRSLFVMLMIMLLGFALGAAQLNADILWVDEMASVSAMGAEDPPYSIQQILGGIAQRIPDHVPLYYVIGAGWARFVGWSQVGLRFLSLLFGVLTIAWVYRFAADVFNRRSASLAAFLFATNAMVIIYFHEVRNYALWLLLGVIHFWHYWRLRGGAKAGISSWFVFVATTSALLYTHPFSPFVLLGLGAQHILLVARNRRWFSILLVWGAGLLTFLPYIPLIAAGISEATDSRSVQAEALSSIQLLPILANVSVNGADFLCLVLIVAGGWTLWRKRSPELLRLVLIVATIAISLLIFHAVDPFVSTRRLRYFLVALSFALVLFAHFLMSMPRWQFLVPAFALVWLAGGYHIYQQAEQWEYAGHHSLLVPHPPLHRFVDALQGKARPQDAILSFTQAGFLNNGLRFGYSTTEYYSRAALGIHGAFIWTGLEGSELREDFHRRVGNHPYLLFTYEPGVMLDNFAEVKTLLKQDYIPCKILVDTEEVFAQRYVYHTLACDRGYHEIHYENGIQIIDAFADHDDVTQTLRIVAGWKVDNKAQLEQYNVSVQIIRPDWQSVGQAPDRHLYDNVLPWYMVELSTEDLPAGDYNAMVILYDRYTIEKVRGVDMTTGQAGDIFSVLTFSK